MRSSKSNCQYINLFQLENIKFITLAFHGIELLPIFTNYRINYSFNLNDFYSILLLFFVGSAAGFINVMAGGGSTITLPVLIFLGLDASVANGTNRIAIFIQNISAVQSFKGEQFFDYKQSLKLSLLTFPGAVAGAILAVNISDNTFKVILGIVMIAVVISMLIPKSQKKYSEESDEISWYTYLAMLGIGFYGGFLQVGVGFLLMASLHYLMKYNLVRVNMHKVFIVLVYTIPALGIFIYTGNVNWFMGLSLASGNAFGAWWSAKLSVKKGDKIIKDVLIIAVIIMSLKLLNVF